MANKNPRRTVISKTSGSQRGSIGHALIVVVLVLTVLLVYLYLFTDVIRPREKVTDYRQPGAEAVKCPLPPRPGQAAFQQASTAKPAEKASATATTQKATTPAALPVKPAPAESPAAAKPVPPPAPAKQVVATTKALPARPGKGPVASTPAKNAAKPVAAPSAPSSAAKSTPETTKTAKVQLPITPKKEELTGKGTKAGEAGYTLLIKGLAGEREAGKARTILQKQGIAPITTRKVNKVNTMHRLFLADFPDRGTAAEESRKLGEQAGGSFVMNENGRYAVYAGSFMHEGHALSEQKRLAGRGIKVSLKAAKVQITVTELSAGDFSSSEEARKEASVLKLKGVAAEVTKGAQKGE